MYKNLAFSTNQADAYYLSEDMADALQYYLLANRERMRPFEPIRPPEYYALEGDGGITARIQTASEHLKRQQGMALAVTPKDSQQIIATVNFSNVVKGAFQACHLGFGIDGDFEGRGIMREVLQQALTHIHHEFGLHRVMANHLPDNHRSETLLARLGFEREGYAKSYLKINGEWQDHVLNAYVFED